MGDGVRERSSPQWSPSYSTTRSQKLNVDSMYGWLLDQMSGFQRHIWENRGRKMLLDTSLAERGACVRGV